MRHHALATLRDFLGVALRRSVWSATRRSPGLTKRMNSGDSSSVCVPDARRDWPTVFQMSSVGCTCALPLHLVELRRALGAATCARDGRRVAAVAVGAAGAHAVAVCIDCGVGRVTGQAAGALAVGVGLRLAVEPGRWPAGAVAEPAPRGSRASSSARRSPGRRVSAERQTTHRRAARRIEATASYRVIRDLGRPVSSAVQSVSQRHDHERRIQQPCRSGSA